MITVSIAINGTVIYARTAVNKGRVDLDSGEDRCYYLLDTGAPLTHTRSDGAVVLAKMMLDTIKEPRSGP